MMETSDYQEIFRVVINIEDQEPVQDFRELLDNQVHLNPNQFKSEEVNYLINLYGNFEFKNIDHLKSSLVQKMNHVDGTIYEARYKPKDRYVKIACKFKGCPFKIWYSFHTNTKNEPIRIRRH